MVYTGTSLLGPGRFYARYERHQLQMSLLRDILPTPARKISIRELIKFKEEYYDQLKRFRTSIESLLIDITAISNEDLRNEKIILVRTQLKQDIDQIRVRMKERNWRHIVLGTICTIIPSLVKTAMGDLTAPAFALPGLAYTIYSAFGTSSIRRKEILRSPLAYAVLCKERYKNTTHEALK